jgi:hypothetical protein
MLYIHILNRQFGQPSIQHAFQKEVQLNEPRLVYKLIHYITQFNFFCSNKIFASSIIGAHTSEKMI